MTEPDLSSNPALMPIILLIDDLLALEADLIDAAEAARPQLERVHPNFQRSALNLIHYLALRNHDIRPLQESLGDLGVSSLGRSEAHVLASIQAVLAILHKMVDREWSPKPAAEEPVGLHEGDALLARHSDSLLGRSRPDRSARIMVTAPTELAWDVDGIRDMIHAGMDILRINCAHDDEETWGRMIANVRQAERDTGRECRIIMDLAGPKLRTGPVEPGPEVLKWRPKRDDLGRILAPARVWLAPAGVEPPAEADAMLPMPAGWLASLASGDRIRFTDTRDSTRNLEIVEREDDGWWGESRQTSYVGTGTTLTFPDREGLDAPVGEISSRPGVLTLRTGDTLALTRSLEPGRPARESETGEIEPARIGCTLPAVFDTARPGERIWFDDGKIGGIIRQVSPGELTIEITRAMDKGSRLRAEKGINLPDTDLNLLALTDKDLADLPFVAVYADMIDYSFVSRAGDVEALHGQLDRLNGRRPGIVLKIETRRAFERLPEVILAAMHEESAGIMIARGDLAVEVGYERLAEVQEEILWLAEAAHLPVIWATQVLETLAQTGLPSRSEITDAAMGERAECVMLNKGPHIIEAIQVLNNILQRMETHQSKKRSLLRRLNAWAPRNDVR